MGKLVRGTRDARTGVTAIRSPDGGYDKIRCPRCGALAVKALSPDGKPVLKCQGPCGSTFRTKSM